MISSILHILFLQMHSQSPFIRSIPLQPLVAFLQGGDILFHNSLAVNEILIFLIKFSLELSEMLLVIIVDLSDHQLVVAGTAVLEEN